MRGLFRHQLFTLMFEKSRELVWLGEPSYLHCSKIVQIAMFLWNTTTDENG
jgi:hypothetical protein